MNLVQSITAKLLFGDLVLALLAALWARGERYARRASASEGLLASAIAIGNANAEISRVQASLAARIDAVAALNDVRKREIRRSSDIRRKVITDVAPETDGPLAPVLRDQLNRLPEPARSDPSRFIAAAQGADVPSAAE